jgi:hypothetical protein
MSHSLRHGLAGLLIGLAATSGVFWLVRAGQAPPPGDVPLIVIDPNQPPAKPPGFAEDRMPAAAVPAVDGAAAHAHLVALCGIGPRVSGSAGMRRQQEVVTKHFESHGAAVRRQEFTAAAASRPRDRVPMANLIAGWHPDRPRRVILCSHYDTRPAAHEEPDRGSWNRPFVSANDGTSGVALLMELARHLKDVSSAVGVDVVLFDGEEYILDPGDYDRGVRGDEYFHGSRHFAAEYRKARPASRTRYEAAILLDLFAAPDARLAVEGYSQRFAPQLVADVWKTAERLGAKSFRYEQGFRRAFEVQDDHLALNEVGIPAIDVIDFDYPHWHRLSDTPDKCSPGQLAQVGRVLMAWLAGLK